jgi:protocatechuate 3,4-dioxygenase alpha subunit
MKLGGKGQDVMVDAATSGQHVRIEGWVLDSDGKPMEDALIEVWQANAAGRYRHHDDYWPDGSMADPFSGFGRAQTDFKTGVYRIETVKPGSVVGPGEVAQAPHLNLIVQARGMLAPSFTRMYFADDAEVIAGDPVLAQVPMERRSTMIANLEETAPQGRPTYHFDIRFGGDDETVFLAF